MEIGMGWLGWDEDTTLDTRMTSIIMAYDGRIKMLRAIFGGEDKPASQGVSMKDPDAVRALFTGMKARQA